MKRDNCSLHVFLMCILAGVLILSMWVTLTRANAAFTEGSVVRAQSEAQAEIGIKLLFPNREKGTSVSNPTLMPTPTHTLTSPGDGTLPQELPLTSKRNPTHTPRQRGASTNTPAPAHTNTLVPTRTNTPAPTRTNTSAPVYTNTPAPALTPSRTPTRTNTPAPTRTPQPDAHTDRYSDRLADTTSVWLLCSYDWE